jgi:hypothetical protein
MAPSNTLGLRSVMFTVESVDETVASMRAHFGAELVGEVAQYENLYRLCYVLSRLHRFRHPAECPAPQLALAPAPLREGSCERDLAARRARFPSAAFLLGQPDRR